MPLKHLNDNPRFKAGIIRQHAGVVVADILAEMSGDGTLKDSTGVKSWLVWALPDRIQKAMERLAREMEATDASLAEEAAALAEEAAAEAACRCNRAAD